MRPWLRLLLALTLVKPGRAQTSPSPDPRPFADPPEFVTFLQEVRERHPDLQRAAATVRMERERVPQAGVLPDPSLSVGLQNDGFKRLEVGRMETSFYSLAFTQPPDGMTFAKDMRFPQCRIELPEVGTLVATLQVRGVFNVTLRSGGRATRVGCQFIRLPGPMVTLVQRYIIKVERERQARDSGIG